MKIPWFQIITVVAVLDRLYLMYKREVCEEKHEVLLAQTIKDIKRDDGKLTTMATGS